MTPNLKPTNIPTQRLRSQQRVSFEGRVKLEHLAAPWDQPLRSEAELAEYRWVCELWLFDIDCKEACPRCGKTCQWTTDTRIFPRGQIAQTTIHAPVCPCPDGHIREAIAKALAEVLVKDYLNHHGTNTAPPAD